MRHGAGIVLLYTPLAAQLLCACSERQRRQERVHTLCVGQLLSALVLRG